jgi:hypothetical protein
LEEGLKVKDDNAHFASAIAQEKKELEKHRNNVLRDQKQLMLDRDIVMKENLLQQNISHALKVRLTDTCEIVIFT